MSSVNKVIIVGRLGNDPEVRQFNNGGGVTHISVATSERWTDKQTGERREQTEWHRISLFNRLGEIAAQYLRKGSMVYIEGSLHTRKYTDGQGIERYATEIRANEMRMLGGGEGGYGGNHLAANNISQQNFNQNDHAQGGYQGSYQNQDGYSQNATANRPMRPNNNTGGQTGNLVNNANNYQAHGGQSNSAPNYPQANQNGFGSPDVAHAPKAVGTQPSSTVSDDDIPF